MSLHTLVLTNPELNYVKNQIIMSYESLCDCCDGDRHIRPENLRWFPQSEADEEFEIIDSLLAKLKENEDNK